MAARQSSAQHPEVGHVLPLWLLFGVFGALIVLTVVTVLASYVDFGGLNIWIAIAIAAVKATLVALVFMHLKWDRPFNGIILASSLLFVVLFLGIALMDKMEYQVEMIPGPAPAFQSP